jgi:hypothetical protein
MIHGPGTTSATRGLELGLLAVLLGCRAVAPMALPTPPGAQAASPAWLNDGIGRAESTISVVGHSLPQPTEVEAREDALKNALRSFVYYAGVEIETFDRAMEIYSRYGTTAHQSLDVRQEEKFRTDAFVRFATPVAWYVRPKDGGSRRPDAPPPYLASVLLHIPESELREIQEQRTVQLALDYGLFQEDSAGRIRAIANGDTLKTGDVFVLYLKPSNLAHVYVFQVDSAGNSFRLFPNDAYHTLRNPVAAGQEIWIPNSSELFRLDATRGRETIFIAAARRPLADLEAGEAATPDWFRQQIHTMGVAGVTSKRSPDLVTPPTKSSATEIRKKIQSGSSIFFEAWFHHE